MFFIWVEYNAQSKLFLLGKCELFSILDKWILNFLSCRHNKLRFVFFFFEKSISDQMKNLIP